jgi:hypothetical protein
MRRKAWLLWKRKILIHIQNGRMEEKILRGDFNLHKQKIEDTIKNGILFKTLFKINKMVAQVF